MSPSIRETWERVRTYWINNQIDSADGWSPGATTSPMVRHRQHDLRRHCLAGHRRRRPPRARRQGLRRPDRRLLSGPLGRPGPDRPGHRLAAAELHRRGPIRPPAPNDGGLWHYYYLYAMERAGRLTARRKIGEHDWYREGASHLVEPIGPVVSRILERRRHRRKQRGHRHQPGLAVPLQGTLARAHGQGAIRLAGGRTPGCGKDIDWNRHRNDVKNLTIYVESKWSTRRRRELTWQTIDLQKATVDDLLQVPVLFFSGGGNPLPESRRKDREGTGRQTSRLHRPRRIHFRRRRPLFQRVRQALPPAHGIGLRRSPSTASSRWTVRIRSGSPTRRSRRSRSACCWASTTAAGRAWSMPPAIRPAIRSRRWPAFGSCRGAGSGTVIARPYRRRSTAAW